MGNDSLQSSPRVLWLQVSLLGLNRFGILLGEREEGQVSIVMGGIFSIKARDIDTKLLSALELNSTLARCNGQINITVADYFQWNGPLFLAVLDQMATFGVVASPEGFLSSVLLWLVIIVAVVGVGVTIVVVIIVAVVVVVESSSVVKLSFVITWILASNTASLGINDPVTFYTAPGFIDQLFSMLAACASRAAVTLSATSFLMAA
ncbi:hypothetical protein Tco_0899873 [Tanacetum coccineum]